MEVIEKSKPQNLTALKVLIADDDPPTRILLRAALTQWGYDIVEAKDGEEAWEILQQPNQPRLLIVDWLMPKLDGIGLCQRIKESETYHPYIILLTQVTGSTNIIKGLEAGANEFLSKPFNMAELRSRLSIGAKIIAYEAELKQNADLVTKMKNIVSQYSHELNDALKELAGQQDNKVIEVAQVQKIQEKIGKILQELESLQQKRD